jgi:hypothetical protein
MGLFSVAGSTLIVQATSHNKIAYSMLWLNDPDTDRPRLTI